MRIIAHAAPVALTLVLALPVAAGLGLTLMSCIPAIPTVLAWPGLPRACLLSLLPGLAATTLSVLLVLLILARRPPAFALLQRLLAPLLALPHAASALGLAFLVAPSGWIARAVSPWLTGWQSPPDLMTLNDPWGLALTLGLVLKETPFLLLVALPAVSRPMLTRQLVARTLGRSDASAFVLAVWPALYPQLRLPILAVLVYAMTNVDMALILGPTLPHPLAVQISLWMTDPSLSHQSEAAAAALLQLALVGVAVALWRGLEAAAATLIRCTTSGFPSLLAWGLTPLATLTTLILSLTPALGLISLALWSIAGLWPFPNFLPQSYSPTVWTRAAPALLQASATTVTLALTATATALMLAIAALQAEVPRRRLLDRLIYLPLILPQVAFLPGIARALIWAPMPPLLAVTLAHLVFVLPYVFLSIAGPFRAWDTKLAAVAATLGAHPLRILTTLRLPMLAPALAAAAAIGVAVSVGQYLPTLLLGGGRVTTLTTEAVALSSGANRRITGAYALMQALWPELAFAAALRVGRRPGVKSR